MRWNPETDGPYHFTLDVDPARLSTAQQKGMFKGRVFTNPKVARGQRIVRDLALPHRARLGDGFHGVPVFAKVSYLFAFPKGGTKAEKAARYEGMPVVSGRYGDLDNRHKAVQDALFNQAGLLSDDVYISTLWLTKRYTFGKPRIEVEIQRDE